MKSKREPLIEKTDEEKLIEMINGILPEFIRMRDQLNGVIMEMEFYRNLRTESGTTKVAKLIMKVCISHFDVSKSQIESKSRETDVRMARQIFMALTRKLTKLSLARVGAMVGKDHATVVHACNVVENPTDPIHEHYLMIKNQVQRALIHVSIESKEQGLL